jgi:hypothetical protein
MKTMKICPHWKSYILANAPAYIRKLFAQRFHPENGDLAKKSIKLWIKDLRLAR